MISAYFFQLKCVFQFSHIICLKSHFLLFQLPGVLEPWILYDRTREGSTSSSSCSLAVGEFDCASSFDFDFTALFKFILHIRNLGCFLKCLLSKLFVMLAGSPSFFCLLLFCPLRLIILIKSKILLFHFSIAYCFIY